MMQHDTILVIEDDPDIRRLITLTLEKGGYAAVATDDGLVGLREFHQRHPTLVVLDVMLPRMNGLEVCRRIREVSEIPVIILSARGHEADKVQGLDVGADDYLTKPFSAQELLARVKAALRRFRTPAPAQEEDVYADSRLRLDFGRRLVYVNDALVHLSPTEYRILELLVRNRGQVLTHDQILERAWGEESESFDGVKQYISYLRRKLGDDPGNPQLIVTVRGVGYRYNR
ncbi:MAG: response regulator transcription factor [Chloroflexi bacterium]|nr:response regulator transcription factor [Chloroflexota bacterium]